MLKSGVLWTEGKFVIETKKNQLGSEFGICIG